MGIDLMELWHAMGLIAKGVVIILALLSAYSISVMIERWLTYRQARKQSRLFTPAVAE
jgi:biopolymer transport protein ExbB